MTLPTCNCLGMFLPSSISGVTRRVWPSCFYNFFSLYVICRTQKLIRRLSCKRCKGVGVTVPTPLAKNPFPFISLYLSDPITCGNTSISQTTAWKLPSNPMISWKKKRNPEEMNRTKFRSCWCESFLVGLCVCSIVDVQYCMLQVFLFWNKESFLRRWQWS